MSLLNRLFSKSVDQKSESQFQENWRPSPLDLRLHTRYPFVKMQRIRIVSQGVVMGTVRDLSYSGLGVDIGGDPNQFPPLFHGELDVLGIRVAFSAQTVFRDGKNVGLSFVHRDTTVLLFLRSLLEQCRLGSTAAEIHAAVLSKTTLDPRMRLWRGEGPCDLAMRFNEDDTLQGFWSRSVSGEGVQVKFNAHGFETTTDVPTYSPDALLELKVNQDRLLNLNAMRDFAFFLLGMSQSFAVVDRLLVQAVGVIDDAVVAPQKRLA